MNAGGDIDKYVADNLKRALGKGSLCHSSRFPCEYCFSKGCKYVKNINGKKFCRIVWPSSTSNGEPRTREKLLEICDKIENSDKKLHPDEAKGVVTKSPLFLIPNFDVVLDVSTEYLHSVCLGVAKRMIELTFSVGESRQRVTKRRLSSPATFNLLMLQIKVPCEFSRRNRELDFGVMKGQEFRNIVLFFFPVVLNSIEKPAQERKLWLLFTYMIRACIIPTEEFKLLDVEVIIDVCDQFYKLYERLFGECNCTYNTHVVSCHLLEMRHSGPLTMTSAFPFEAFYGEIRNSFYPGTQSSLKQIFKNILLKRNLSHHCCEQSIRYSSKETNLENDTLIYCFQDYTHKMYRICEVHADYVICKRQGRRTTQFPEMPRHNFSQIGIYEKGALAINEEKIMKNNIDGKIIEVMGYLITCPNAILREK